eukprot:6146593-Prymnesium_polylepis.1
MCARTRAHAQPHEPWEAARTWRAACGERVRAGTAADANVAARATEPVARTPAAVGAARTGTAPPSGPPGPSS